jgi:hypothetical protein
LSKALDFQSSYRGFKSHLRDHKILTAILLKTSTLNGTIK